MTTCTIDDVNVPAEEGHPQPASSPMTADALSPPGNPQQHLNWRFRYAMYLADDGHLTDDGDALSTPQADPWIQAAVDFCITSKSHDRTPTQTDLAIYRATQLWQSDCLARHLLEARLLAQQTPEEIHTRCALSELTITAYRQLHFDVVGRDRKGIWLLHPFSSGLAVDTEISHFGWRLKQLACFSTSEALEHTIRALQRLEGKTLIAGMPQGDDPDYAPQMAQRLTIARTLLPMSPSAEKLLNRMTRAAANDLQVGRTSQKTADLGRRVLRNVQVPERLRQELRSLRKTLPATRKADAVTNA